MNLGFIGLGIMGQPMSRRLLQAGFNLIVYTRTPARAQAVMAMGAQWAESPADVAARSEIIITMLPDTPEVETVLFGENGVYQGLSAGKIVVDMSTISPEATVKFAEQLRARECELLDAPVSGGESGAIAGTLTIMVGGNENSFQKCLPVFQAMGKNIVHLGTNGDGQRAKLVNQVICALNILAMSEGLHLAERLGLDREKVLQVVSAGAAASWMLSNLAPRILHNDFRPGFKIKLQQKDLRLAMELIQALGENFPGTALAYSLFNKAVEQGLGEQGTQGLINLFKKQSRV
ncbi:MAG: NAD(P)-dependent oxidoreductase [candidate division KSB1 bacterium]|nr:NAD(P)-dependent oxidoreductase [candidate division KSB1 bacterium]MDZ7303387.1 NAD(P)-dependent oxidoreductase [candidate division KSB1 bacterium]MDZ7312295.1 NAD(P)-dependent oxidoreductase [candidate division KSB1 bacterium]